MGSNIAIPTRKVNIFFKKRTDNGVKNHFYSKLRKSLRALNKIAKSYLKKTCREVSGQVIFKLTEATDEALSQVGGQ